MEKIENKKRIVTPAHFMICGFFFLALISGCKKKEILSRLGGGGTQSPYPHQSIQKNLSETWDVSVFCLSEEDSGDIEEDEQNLKKLMWADLYAGFLSDKGRLAWTQWKYPDRNVAVPKDPVTTHSTDDKGHRDETLSLDPELDQLLELSKGASFYFQSRGDQFEVIIEDTTVGSRRVLETFLVSTAGSGPKGENDYQERRSIGTSTLFEEMELTQDENGVVSMTKKGFEAPLFCYGNGVSNKNYKSRISFKRRPLFEKNKNLLKVTEKELSDVFPQIEAVLKKTDGTGSFNPSQVLVILDLDGTLTNVANPGALLRSKGKGAMRTMNVKEFLKSDGGTPDQNAAYLREGAPKLLKNLTAAGFKLILSSALIDVKEALTVEKIYKVLSLSGWDSSTPYPLGLPKPRPDSFDIQKGRVPDRFAPVYLRYQRYQNVISVAPYEATSGLARAKAYSALVGLSQAELADLKHVFFVDDSSDNIDPFEKSAPSVFGDQVEVSLIQLTQTEMPKVLK